MRQVLLSLCVLLLPALAAAQVSGPAYVFSDGTVASAAEVNTNFSTIYGQALNRLGGTMAGALLFSPDNTYDIGASGATRPRDFFLGRHATIGGNATVGGTLSVTGAATFGTATITTLTCTGCVDSTQLAATAATPGNYGGTTTVPEFDVDADGRITSVTEVSTASLTGIVEGGITDGSILARVASSETISGAWTFTAPLYTSAAVPEVRLYESDQGVDGKLWSTLLNEGAFEVRVFNDADDSSAVALSVARSGMTVGAATWNVSQHLSAQGSASAPTYGRSGDPNTGMWFPNADEIGWTTGGTNRLTLSTSALTSTVGFSGTTGTFSGALSATTGTFAGHTSPTADSTYDLGTTAVRWRTVYADDVVLTNGYDFSGTLLIRKGTSDTDLAIAFSADTNTGLWGSANNDTLRFVAGGSYVYSASTDGGFSHSWNLGSGSAVSLQPGQFFPVNTNEIDLGGSSTRFKTLYLVNAPDVSSDARVKHDIRDHEHGLAFIRALRPTTYAVQDGSTHYGFLAQQVLEAAPGYAAVNTRDPDHLSLRYDELLPSLVRALQELAARVDLLEGVRP